MCIAPSFKHVLLAFTLAAWSMAGQASGQGRERDPGRPDAIGIVKAVGDGKITITVGGDRRETAGADHTYALAKDVEVALGATRGGTGLPRAAKLTDLAEGVRVLLTLSAEKKTVDGILAESPMARGIVKSVDAKKASITIEVMGREGGETQTYAVAPRAEIAIDDGRGRRFSIKEATLADIAEGATVTCSLSLDKKEVQGVVAEGANLQGVIKSVDAARKRIILATPPGRGAEAPEETTLQVSVDATVLVDDGKGRRLSIKEAKLADLPIGAYAHAKLSPDGSFAMFLKAEGPTLFGVLKGVDAVKGTLIIAVPRGRDEPEEKTVPVAKGARVFIEGAESTLEKLKVGEDGPLVQVRFALDGSMAWTIVARMAGPRER